MKIKICLLILISTLLSCSDNEEAKIENAGLLGKWKLIKTLANLGDGSGVFTLRKVKKQLI